MLATKQHPDAALLDNPLAPLATQPDLRVVAQNPQRRTKINVVLFSGGSGTQSITEAFLRHPQISLKILINAYDDGH